MFLGADAVVADEAVLFVLPRETTQISYDTRRALFALMGAGRIDTRAGDAQKSYVVTEADGQARVHASPISSARLIGRNG